MKHINYIIDPFSFKRNKFKMIHQTKESDIRYYYNEIYILDEDTILVCMICKRNKVRTNFIASLSSLELIKSRVWYPHHDKTKPDTMIYVLSKGGIRLHRMLVNPSSGKIVDHINRLPLDNRIENLREVSIKENNQNVSIHRNNKVGIKGVFYDKSKSMWVAHIYRNGKTYSKYSRDMETAIKNRTLLEIKFDNNSTTIPEMEVKS